MTSNIPEYIQAAVSSERRPERDTARDAGRRPAQLMSFFDIEPGQTVAELNSGWGYITGLLSEIVGNNGKVYSHTTEASIKRWNGNPIEKRIEKNGIHNIEIVVGTMDAPGLPSGLDAVLMIMNYHDAVWSGADRPAMNTAVYEALKSGGVFCVLDHQSQPGRGTEDCQSIHRIDKQVVIDEITTAGFELDGESDILENPDDPRTGQVHGKDIRDQTDRFVLKFRRP
jgi:predicted methyltransferase